MSSKSKVLFAFVAVIVVALFFAHKKINKTLSSLKPQLETLISEQAKSFVSDSCTTQIQEMKLEGLQKIRLERLNLSCNKRSLLIDRIDLKISLISLITRKKSALTGKSKALGQMHPITGSLTLASPFDFSSLDLRTLSVKIAPIPLKPLASLFADGESKNGLVGGSAEGEVTGEVGISPMMGQGLYVNLNISDFSLVGRNSGKSRRLRFQKVDAKLFFTGRGLRSRERVALEITQRKKIFAKIYGQGVFEISHSNAKQDWVMTGIALGCGQQAIYRMMRTRKNLVSISSHSNGQVTCQIQ